MTKEQTQLANTIYAVYGDVLRRDSVKFTSDGGLFLQHLDRETGGQLVARMMEDGVLEEGMFTGAKKREGNKVEFLDAKGGRKPDVYFSYYYGDSRPGGVVEISKDVFRVEYLDAKLEEIPFTHPREFEHRGERSIYANLITPGGLNDDELRPLRQAFQMVAKLKPLQPFEALDNNRVKEFRKEVLTASEALDKALPVLNEALGDKRAYHLCQKAPGWKTPEAR